MKKVLFIYKHPHEVHEAFARSLDADFIKGGPDWLSPPYYFATSFIRTIFNLKLLKYDILFIEGTTGLYLAYWIKRLNPKVKIVYLDADPFFSVDIAKYHGFKRKLISKLLHIIDGIITDSFSSMAFAKRYMKVPIEVAHPFIYEKKFINVKSDLDSKKIVFVGRLHEVKNLHNIFKAFEIVNKRHPDSELYIIGDGPLRMELEKEAVQNINFLGFQKNPQKFMDNASIGILASKFEAYGCAAVEYAAAGLIPIISNTMGAKEVLNDRRIMVDPDNVKEIADKIIKIFEMPLSEKKKLQNKLKKIALNNNHGNAIKEFTKSFDNVLSKI